MMLLAGLVFMLTGISALPYWIDEPTPTSAPPTASACVVVRPGDASNQGQNGELDLSFPASANGWVLYLWFDGPVSSLSVDEVNIIPTIDQTDN